MQPATYTKIYIQIVFAVKGRNCLLRKEHREELYKYTSGIITNKKCKSIIVNGYTDHIHILVGLNPSVSISDLVRDIKRSTTLFINHEKKWFRNKFSWQQGYGAFSYSYSQIENVYNYIKNQEQHHSRQSFRNEYLEVLDDFDLEYDERCLFDFIA